MNWDDLKFFLSVARYGSVRGAAKALSVNHATVSRRVRQFEEALGQRLFERTAYGYVKTQFAEEIYAEAIHLEERLSAVSRKVAGSEQTLQGDIRVTMHDGLAQQFLMDDFAAFCSENPDVELEIIDSERPLNLTNREADVAFRFCKQPPEHLVGRRLAKVHRSCYVSKRTVAELGAQKLEKSLNWIGWNDKMRRPIGLIAKEYPRFESRHKIMNVNLQVSACRAGMGVGILPCFLADSDSELVRVPPYISEHKYDLWLLYHPDLRASAKINTFVQFIYARMEVHRPLFEGECFRSELQGAVAK